ncbi:MAG: DR2241 family protein [Rubrobacteraceae bacterium]
MRERTGNVAAEAREAFAAWISESDDGRVFGEVRIEKDGSGYSIRHIEDEGGENLDVSTDPTDAREISRFTESGEYRPLKSSPNLRRRWELRLSGEAALVSAMNYFYPAGAVHWHLDREGELETTSFRENASRQSGMYERVKHLSDEAAQNAAKACCEDDVCLKKTLWDIDDDTPLEAERGDGEIPCPEPCSVFVSFARRVRSFEKEEIYADSDGLTPSEKEDIAALVDGAASGGVSFAREAEFEEPVNERRMRYRRLTLAPKLRPEGDSG